MVKPKSLSATGRVATAQNSIWFCGMTHKSSSRLRSVSIAFRAAACMLKGGRSGANDLTAFYVNGVNRVKGVRHSVTFSLTENAH
jgi:hypothetical protein